MRFKSLLASLAVVASATAAFATAADPAYANTAAGYISGAGVVTDDLNDEGTLSTSVNNFNGAVWLWQSILIADGFLSTSGRDCQFGAGTKAATKLWQAAHGLTGSDADGVVGPKTFTAAGKNWKLYSYDEDDQIYTARYYGSKSSFPAERMLNGRYQMAAYAMYLSYTGYNVDYC
ncbi:peptidoglycan-binding domain-containing protein [Paractinoplanes toevensis]|uniref:Peptidoglycan binding-like domain-containing protein n=1 Tax=Paractinoplanes toevensis TaxID=571911 RepID=A0A919WBS9_9ACTN|nr:peptidoglycan-binding protein [Actinoplanes toevensis]GIM97324.1 hypothetical protein Ato02nite_091170 [Actinoplanes toevensis]